uniref:Uncharacterized protein n=1 Tax=Arundo donax TaxID=35708 RepID=A0A0A9HDF5_ARUDO
MTTVQSPSKLSFFQLSACLLKIIENSYIVRLRQSTYANRRSVDAR